MQHLSLFCMSICVLMLACNGSKQGTSTPNAPTNSTPTATPLTETPEQMVKSMMEKAPLSLGIKRSQCFGKCPAFEFTVNRDGSMMYKGKAHVERLGTWRGQMSAASRDALWKFFSEQYTDNLESIYNSGAMDTPRSTLMIGRKDSIQKISGDFSMPKHVIKIINFIDSLSTNTSELKLFEANVPRGGIVPGQALIDLAPNGSIESICENYKDYGLVLEKRVSPALSYYVLNFDESKINPGRMLVLLKEHPMIQEAQFNKTVDQRKD